MFKRLFSFLRNDGGKSIQDANEVLAVENSSERNDDVLSDSDIQRFVKMEVNKRILQAGGELEELDVNDLDNLLPEASRLIVIHQQGSTSLIQRKMKLGYNRAGRIMDQMEMIGIIGPFTGSKAREVLFNNLGDLEKHLGVVIGWDSGIAEKYSTYKGDMLLLYEDEINFKVDLYFKDLEEKKRLQEIEDIKADILEKERLKKERIRVAEQRRQIEKELSEQGLISVVPDYRRDPISQEVKDQVWNRDQGKCVECARSEKLEFDHIIPLSKGGANTYRNLQLLCEECNRKKSNKIG